MPDGLAVSRHHNKTALRNFGDKLFHNVQFNWINQIVRKVHCYEVRSNLTEIGLRIIVRDDSNQ